MSLRILIDVNLSPDWVDELTAHGWEAVHWSTVGAPNAPDLVLFDSAREKNDQVVFTHDLDFGTMLALTHADGPSVVQVRGQNVLPDFMGPVVVAAVERHRGDLEAGALLVVDVARARVRLLPI